MPSSDKPETSCVALISSDEPAKIKSLLLIPLALANASTVVLFAAAIFDKVSPDCTSTVSAEAAACPPTKAAAPAAVVNKVFLKNLPIFLCNS